MGRPGTTNACPTSKSRPTGAIGKRTNIGKSKILGEFRVSTQGRIHGQFNRPGWSINLRRFNQINEIMQFTEPNLSKIPNRPARSKPREKLNRPETPGRFSRHSRLETSNRRMKPNRSETNNLHARPSRLETNNQLKESSRNLNRDMLAKGIETTAEDKVTGV
jgi:hypothetical protein